MTLSMKDAQIDASEVDYLNYHGTSTDLNDRNETLAVKKRLIRDAIDREYLIFFEHDPVVAAGYIREQGGRRYVEQVL